MSNEFLILSFFIPFFVVSLVLRYYINKDLKIKIAKSKEFALILSELRSTPELYSVAVRLCLNHMSRMKAGADFYTSHSRLIKELKDVREQSTQR